MLKTVLLTNTSWWACASRLAIGLTECGCHVSAAYPSHGHPLAKTRNIRQSFPYSAVDPVRSLKNAIQAASPDLIIPCDDRAVEHLHRLHARTSGSAESEVAELIERSLGSSISFSTTLSRSALIATAAALGIRVPATWKVFSPAQLNGSVGTYAFPWVLKSCGSWGGHGVRIVHSHEQAESAFRELSRPLTTARFMKRLLVDRDPYWMETWRHRTRPDVIAQAYIKGRPANMVASCWQGELLDAISAEVIQAQGAKGAATVVSIVDNPAMVEAAELLARHLELTGFFGLDFMIEEQTGQAYLIEMNPRCTPLSHLALGEGRDPVAALAARLSGKPARARTPLTQEEQIAYFPQAWHWDPNSDFLNTSFCDVPYSEPELVRDLLQVPWPDRGLLARLANHLRRERFEDRRSRGGDFSGALTASKESEQDRGQVACAHPASRGDLRLTQRSIRGD